MLAMLAFVVLGAGPALAHECANASKPQDKGWRVLVVIDPVTEDETLVFNSEGLRKQFESDPDAAMKRFSGVVGVDFTGDGVADVQTYIVGPEDVIPYEAQSRGAACKGIVNIGDYFDCAFA